MLAAGARRSWSRPAWRRRYSAAGCRDTRSTASSTWWHWRWQCIGRRCRSSSGRRRPPPRWLPAPVVPCRWTPWLRRSRRWPPRRSRPSRAGCAYPVADGHRAAAFHLAHYAHALVEVDRRHTVVAAGFSLRRTVVTAWTLPLPDGSTQSSVDMLQCGHSSRGPDLHVRASMIYLHSQLALPWFSRMHMAVCKHAES